METDNPFVVVMTDTFSKLTKATLTTERQQPQPQLTSSMTGWWTSEYRPISWLITAHNSRPNSFRRVSKSWGWSRWYLQSTTSRKVEHFNATIVLVLLHYVAAHQQDWDSYVVSPTYAYNTQLNCAVKLPPFVLVLSRQLPSPTTPTASPMPSYVKYAHSTTALRIRFIRGVAKMIQYTFTIDLLTRITHPNKSTEENGEHHNNKANERYGQPPLSPNVDRQHVVNHIISHLETPMGKRYVVRWYGYTQDDDTTEPAANTPQHFCDANEWRLCKQK